MYGPALRDHWLDTAITQGSPMPLGVVAAIGVDDAVFLQRPQCGAVQRDIVALINIMENYS